MRLFISVFIFHFFGTIAAGQKTEGFNIEIQVIADSAEFLKSIDFEREDSVFYQDENYLVRRTCVGEFGGTIWFRNKETAIEYSCAAQYPVSVNKINDTYFVTTKLAHFQPRSRIFAIDNPDSMATFQIPEMKRARGKLGFKKRKWHNWRFQKVYHPVSAEKTQSQSYKGTRNILDTTGVNILLSFEYQNNFYHLVRANELLCLSRLVGTKLMTVDTIYTELDRFDIHEQGTNYNYSTESFKTGEKSYAVLFKNSGIVGHLIIEDNEITLTRIK